ncbi:hypothetical protein LCGC14_1969460 [marine sediment metagenome]|uniref:Uncharacterized protein n=1 Tax=marine sediment metagenome TaxID=412755 RepID=A0A0F9G0G0_9ZZZZ
MNKVVIEMPYIGSVLSVNHYLGRNRHGGVYVKAGAKEWGWELGWKIKQYHIEDWKLPLHVTCDGQFVDARSAPDLSNLSKVTLDAIEETTGVNDRDMRWHDGERTLKKDEPPYLRITIEEG